MALGFQAAFFYSVRGYYDDGFRANVRSGELRESCLRSR